MTDRHLLPKVLKMGHFWPYLGRILASQYVIPGSEGGVLRSFAQAVQDMQFPWGNENPGGHSGVQNGHKLARTDANTIITRS